MAVKPKPVKATEAVDVDPPVEAKAAPVEAKAPPGQAKKETSCAVCGSLVAPGATCEVDGWPQSLPVPA